MINKLNKIIEYGLYLLVFLLPVQARWIIKAGFNEYQTYSLYGTDILLLLVLLLFIFSKFSIFPGQAGTSNYQFFWLRQIWQSQTNNFQLKFKIQNLLIFGLVAVSAVSAFFAADKALALYKLGWLLLGVGLFWLITKADYGRLKLIYALLAGVFLQAGLGIWQFFTQSSFANKWLGLALHNPADLGVSVIEALGADGVGERWLRAYGGLDHPNILGGLLAVGILLTIYLILIETPSEKSPALRATPLLKGSIIIFSAALFFTFSRSAWLALTAGLTIMIIGAVVKKDLITQKSLAKIILTAGVLFFIMSVQYQNLVSVRLSGEGRLENKSNEERLVSYSQAGELIKNNWLIGTGLGNYTLALNRELPGQAAASAKALARQASYFYQPAHNVFLLVWAETGVLGFLFFVGLIILILISNIQYPISNKILNLEIKKLRNYLGFGNWDLGFGKNKNGTDKAINLSILIALIILLSFDHWLWSLHFGILFFWLLLGIVSREDEKLNP